MVVQIFDEYFPILGPCITDFARISDSTCLLCQISNFVKSSFMYILVKLGSVVFAVLMFFFAEYQIFIVPNLKCMYVKLAPGPFQQLPAPRWSTD